MEGGLLGRRDVDGPFAVTAEAMVEGHDHLELATFGDGKRFLLGSRNVRVGWTVEIVNVGDRESEEIRVESFDFGLGESSSGIRIQVVGHCPRSYVDRLVSFSKLFEVK